ncbi:aminotransferase [Salmonella enterica subsp. enterica]|uniref:Aminotransferase n=1 Tax=Salmonella enterica I TaxID=59201 RepID=A0A3S4GLG7_SALET|nr:aminotransferase [Salmonella enterica subsp. enterica]
MDFNQIINRNNTGSVKWDFIERHFGDGAGKLLPMWVSDFDFACPPEVQAALHQRIEHGVFGYSERDEAYFNALLHWFSSRHQLTLKQEWVCSVEGVRTRVGTLGANVDASRRRRSGTGAILWLLRQNNHA